MPNVADHFPVLQQSILETLQMVLAAGLISFFLGVLLGTVLTVTRRNGILPNPAVYQVLDKLINLFRSIPFIVLPFCLLPLTRLLVGTAIGVQGAIVPLVFGTTPFFARQIEASLWEISSAWSKLRRPWATTILRSSSMSTGGKALPGIARGTTITLISLIGLTAMAGAVGAGGLGNYAYIYGQQRNRMDIIYVYRGDSGPDGLCYPDHWQYHCKTQYALTKQHITNQEDFFYESYFLCFYRPFY